MVLSIAWLNKIGLPNALSRSIFGSPANLNGSVALRPRFPAGLPLSALLTYKYG